MDLVIHHEPFRSVKTVIIHAWEKGGRVWDFSGERQADGSALFVVKDISLTDLRDLSLKFRYLDDNGVNVWEDEDYVRQAPTKDAQELWTFGFTPRCLTQPPGETTTATHVTFNVITFSQYIGGQVFIWDPNSGKSFCQSQARRDDTNKLSTFILPLQDWMRKGFHFKLKSAKGGYESDGVNRVWRPCDGTSIWIKAGQLDVRPQPIELVTETIELLYPSCLGSVPILDLQDRSDEFQVLINANQSPDNPSDPLFRTAEYSFQVFRGATYDISFKTPGNSGDPRRPFRLRVEDPLGTTKALYGNWLWLTVLPTRTTEIQLVIHPNPHSSFDADIPLEVGVGQAPSHEHGLAQKQTDGTWTAQFHVFPELLQRIGLVRDHGITEAWCGIPLASQWREFRPEADRPTTYHTLDGISGMALEPPSLHDPTPGIKKELMSAAFHPAIVEANVFNGWEMPHGCIKHQGKAWFTVCAPHAIAAKVLILDPTSSDSGPRHVREYPMTLTSDLRYWWCAIPAEEAVHGSFYRFQLNNVQEVIDPASRWVSEADNLNAKPNEGKEGSWSRVVDQDALHHHFHGSHWQTMGWQALVIYELHAKRLTKRNLGVSSVFDQLIHELQSNGYLHRLPVTALELLPLNEFPKDNSWGYNSSLYFAIESSYGGPEEFARFVRSSHDAGKAVLLDVVYNHLSDSPLQTFARDIYADGETEWGDMVNYDHPMVREFFRQAFLFQWLFYCLDGFRFDCTRAIVDGQHGLDQVIKYRDGRWQTGSGGGWDFLKELRLAVRTAATAIGRHWPYLVAENDPNNWPLTDHSGVLDGQWHFGHNYPLGDAAKNKEDKVADIRDQMNYPHSQMRPYYEAVRYGENHDIVSAQDRWKQRIVRREPFGFGRRMAKAVGTAAILAKGVPMLFMGEEAGEDEPFAFGESHTLNLNAYEDLGNEMNRVYAWFRDIIGLRNNPTNQLQGDDNQSVCTGVKTIAFTRGWGRFFVICTFGTPNTQQNSGWLGLPASTPYKEIFNSSWPVYQVKGEHETTNGGYNARIYSGHIISLPYIGSVILERI